MSQNMRVLIAEGDSWFDYPPYEVYPDGTPCDHYEESRYDVLKSLEKLPYGYTVKRVAHAGDRVEDMAYGGPQHVQLAELMALIGKAPKDPPQDPTPIAVLLSGGGIDLVAVDSPPVPDRKVKLPTATAFGMLLNHARSAVVLAGQNELNESVVTGLIDQRLRDAYVTMLRKVTEFSKPLNNNNPLPILVHGYDYPVPDGVGGILGPAFVAKGYGKMEVEVHLPTPAALTAEQREQLQVRIAVMKQLIDRFNAMLRDVADRGEFAHVRYVDLRGTLKTGLQGNGYDFYQRWWENELHPTVQGFKHIAKRFHEELEELQKLG